MQLHHGFQAGQTASESQSVFRRKWQTTFWQGSSIRTLGGNGAVLVGIAAYLMVIRLVTRLQALPSTPGELLTE